MNFSSVRIQPRENAGKKPEPFAFGEVFRTVIAGVEFGQIAVVEIVGDASYESQQAFGQVVLERGIVLYPLVVEGQGGDAVAAELAGITDAAFQVYITVTGAVRLLGAEGRFVGSLDEAVSVFVVVVHHDRVLRNASRRVCYPVGAVVVVGDFAPYRQPFDEESEVVVQVCAQVVGTGVVFLIPLFEDVENRIGYSALVVFERIVARITRNELAVDQTRTSSRDRAQQIVENIGSGCVRVVAVREDGTEPESERHALHHVDVQIGAQVESAVIRIDGEVHAVDVVLLVNAFLMEHSEGDEIFGPSLPPLTLTLYCC